MINYSEVIEKLRVDLVREQTELNALQNKVYKRLCEISGALSVLRTLDESVEAKEV